MLCCKARAGSRKADGGRREIWGRGLMLPEREKPTRLMRRAIIHVNGGVGGESTAGSSTTCHRPMRLCAGWSRM